MSVVMDLTLGVLAGKGRSRQQVRLVGSPSVLSLSGVECESTCEQMLASNLWSDCRWG